MTASPLLDPPAPPSPRAGTAGRRRRSRGSSPVLLPSPESIVSVLTYVLAALASLRAASRLERRLNAYPRGSVGLMDGPPVVGPPSSFHSSLSSPPSSVAAGDGGEDGSGSGIVEASPLWEQTQAFRRAVVLGMIFGGGADADIDGHGGFSTAVPAAFDDLSVRFSETEPPPSGRAAAAPAEKGFPKRGEDLAIDAAVDAGLLSPRHSSRSYKNRRRPLRGGGGDHPPRTGEDGDNPVVAAASWLVRELSAPATAILAWRGMLRSCLRDEGGNASLSAPWGTRPWVRRLASAVSRAGGRGKNDAYDPSGLDMGSSVSGIVRVPRGAAAASSAPARRVRVTAHAPGTFRNLRDCFRIRESEYARSILNVVDGMVEECDNAVEAEKSSVIPQCWLSPPPVGSLGSLGPVILKELRAYASGGGEEGRNRGAGTTPTAAPYISFQSNSKGAARMGTSFFFTADGAYMVKSVKREEARAFMEMLPEYHRFMSDSVNGRKSLLTRVCGMYSVRFLPESGGGGKGEWNGGLFETSDDGEDDDERVFLVMNSVFPAQASTFLTERFDLKGSTVGRECSPEERKTGGCSAVLKDVDLQRDVENARLVEMVSSSGGGGGPDTETGNEKRRAFEKKKLSGYGIHVGPRRRTALLAQLRRDVKLLRRCGVMDYSVLVGVADMGGGRLVRGGSAEGVCGVIQRFFSWMDYPLPYYGAGATAVDGGEFSTIRGTRNGRPVTYYMGVIDFLQPWTMKKRLERDLKGLAGYDTNAISCVAPADYAERFLKFIGAHFS